MKKSAIFLGIMAVLLLSGCGQEKEITSEPTPIPAEEEIVEEVNSLSPACVKSTDELEGIFASLPGRAGESDFVSRGTCTGDIVAASGNYIYVLRDYELEICRMDGEGAAPASAVQTGFLWEEDNGDEHWSGREKQCVSLLLSGSRLVVLSDLFAYSIADAGGAWSGVDSSRCVADVYDLSEPENPQLLRSFAQTGSWSCALIADGRLCLVTDRKIYRDDTLGEGTLPGWWQDGKWTALAPDSLYNCARGMSGYLQLGVYPLDTASEPEQKALIGCGTEALLCERGLYALIPEDDGSIAYYLPVENGRIGAAVGSVFAERYDSVSELTGAGNTLCRLQDGDLKAEGYDWQRRWDDGSILALAVTENAMRLSLLGGSDCKELSGLTLGWDFRSALDAADAIYTDAERGLIGLPCEDGYSLYSLEDGEFRHLLDCFSSDLPQNRRIVQRNGLLCVADRQHLFTVDLNGRKLLSSLTF